MGERNGGGQVAEELRALVSDAESLLRSTASAGGADVQERAQVTLQELRARLNALEETVRSRARDVDSYVHDNPWQAVAAVGGIALLLGLLMGRR
ncbi:MAG: DUF883 domain-containing protein [Gammaproteobacteria bacterium]|nr:DUF883 domain-containing protein [Gammaproteobacteria bacterium]MBV9318062.1 DUF883 domain-containing protein [Gammaproteobacteria bacterium]MBV9724819.1 DUF883 domain-containing protein [Gammaproteobacteria bacterium]